MEYNSNFNGFQMQFYYRFISKIIKAKVNTEDYYMCRVNGAVEHTE